MIIRRGEAFLNNNMSEKTLENRELFVEFCKENNLIVANTLFAKRDLHFCTYKEMTTESVKEPWSPDRFACLESQARAPLFRPPSQKQKEQYNAYVSKLLSEIPDAEKLDIDRRLNQFVQALLTSARKTLDAVSPKQKKQYISQYTWELIEQRQRARESGDAEEEKNLTKLIKTAARKDKQNYVVQTLETRGSAREQWQGIKNLKTKFVPNYTKLKDMRGSRVPYGERAKATAEYLHEVQWKQGERIQPAKAKTKVIKQDLGMNVQDITMKELVEIVQRQKKNKAAGPDQVRVELIQYLDEQNLNEVL